MVKPLVDRPVMPAGYGVEDATEFVEWSMVEAKLADSLHYWLSTVMPTHAPHVVPRWGVWLRDRFWYDGSPETRHVQNLNENQQCALNLEDGAAAVIVYGMSEPAQPALGDWGQELSVEFGRKYGPEYEPKPDAWSEKGAGGLRVLQPRVALAWTGFPTDMTRFRFD